MPKQIIRVFPRWSEKRPWRSAKWHPRDSLVFHGDPPLIRPEADEVHISVAFSWDISAGKRLAEAWRQYYPRVRLGGPALCSDANSFIPGLYVKKGVTFTSRGCEHLCPWCLVPEREGRLRLLEPTPGYIIQDNNLLQTGRTHISKVFAMLRQQTQSAEFSGGLEAALVDGWVAEELRGLRITQVFLACDTDGALTPLQRAVNKLSFLGRDKLRCYVLLGYGGESLEAGLCRLIRVWEMGCLPFAQLYQPPDKWIDYPQEWRILTRTWSRPAATKAYMRGQDGIRGQYSAGVRRDNA